ncbi:phage tail family protein [Streptomyces sp. SCA3-4]|uniref:phage tail domain-containing protein n=1 Tax=Streptomyces sichuanensis TaxID=2871810 RepID=UPI001CE2A9FE|nr:phage tail domain-containing protein [Streptomyces sichuanensis]MCA6090941.1 phage tail family protein [Streptomyces sichuanensis]
MSLLATLNSPSAIVSAGILPEPQYAAPDTPPRVTLTAGGQDFLLTADLSHKGACIAILPGPTGLDAPPVQATVTEYAGMDGGRLVKTRAASRRITLPLLLWAPTRPELLALKRSFVAAVVAGRGPCTLRVAEADGTARSIRVHYTSGMEGDEGTDAAGLTYIRYGLQLSAPDPYLYGDERTETFRVHGAPAFLSHPSGSWTALLSDTMNNPSAWTTAGTVLNDRRVTDGQYTRLPAGRAEATTAVPYDGSSLYRLTARVRRSGKAPADVPTSASVGLAGAGPDGARFITAARLPLTDADGWVEVTGYARGWDSDSSPAAGGAAHPLETAPGSMPVGTVTVRPVIQSDATPLDVDHLTLARLDATPAGEPHTTPFFPLRIAPSVISDEGLPVQVTSDVDAWPVWRITGPLGQQDAGQPVVPLRLANRTTGQQLILSYGIPAGRTVVIDTRPGIKAVHLENPDGTRGENLWPYLTGPASLWQLVPGENRIALTATGASEESAVTLTYQPRHLGA